MHCGHVYMFSVLHEPVSLLWDKGLLLCDQCCDLNSASSYTLAYCWLLFFCLLDDDDNSVGGACRFGTGFLPLVCIGPLWGVVSASSISPLYIYSPWFFYRWRV